MIDRNLKIEICLILKFKVCCRRHSPFKLRHLFTTKPKPVLLPL